MTNVEKISIALSADMVTLVRRAVETGDYASSSEAIREAMREWKARRAGPESEKAATLICTTFEAMGVLVHRRIAPLSLVQDLAGGFIVVTWRRLQPWLTELRIEQNNPSDSEWFQWLAEQLERRKEAKTPAYLLHRDWAP